MPLRWIEFQLSLAYLFGAKSLQINIEDGGRKEWREGGIICIDGQKLKISIVKDKNKVAGLHVCKYIWKSAEEGEKSQVWIVAQKAWHTELKLPMWQRLRSPVPWEIVTINWPKYFRMAKKRMSFYLYPNEYKNECYNMQRNSGLPYYSPKHHHCTFL